MKNKSLQKVSFVPLKKKDQKLVKQYTKALGYQSILNNKERINIVIDNHNRIFLVVKRDNHIFCYKNGIYIPIYENQISQIEVFRKKFNHLNIHNNIISVIFGLSLYAKETFSI
ncbi:MAG: hypothetical protein JXR64_02820 [Spirochaetales bacterium]|nr:hypothetical protein [Spirochaetales bacterium]